MAFQSFELTNSGINLLAQVQAQLGTLNFTRVKIGSGDYTGDIKDLTDVITEFHNFPVTSTSVQPDSSVKLQAPFNNETFTQSYTWREIGVFAKLGDTGTEILYSYSKDPTPEIIPDYDGGNNIYRRTLDLRNYISDVGNVNLEIVEVKDKYDFSTTLEMQTANYLTEGDRVKTWGDLSLGDNNGSEYIIGLTGDVLLDNGLYAKIYIVCPFPIDSIYLSMGVTDPSILWPLTTWSKISDGRFLLGDDIPGQTGGSLTISENNLPIHSHAIGDHTHSATTSLEGEHSHTTTRPRKSGDDAPVTEAGWGADQQTGANASYPTNDAGEHNHTITIDSVVTGDTGNTGLGEDYIQPYLTCCMWQRIS